MEMFDIQREELMWGGRKLVLETGKIARQATRTAYLESSLDRVGAG